MRPLQLFIGHIGPVNTLQEQIYGLVMVLATISTVSVVIGLDTISRDVLTFTALGVNLTWGIADMVIYMVIERYDISRRHRLTDIIRAGQMGEGTMNLIEREMERTIVGELDPADRQRICQDIMVSGSRASEDPGHHGRALILGGISYFIITLVPAIVVVLPLLLIEPLELAVRISSLLAAALLFLTGYMWAPLAGMGRLSTGLILLMVGIIITLATLLMGG